MKLAYYPDPILLKRAEAVQRFNGPLQSLVREMFELMYEEKGVGLAAPQIFWSQRLFIVNIQGREKPQEERIYINPEILRSEGEVVEEEGCLSIPGIRANVARAAKVQVRAQDLQGKWFEEEADGLKARVIQHELDHLDGILFIQRLGFSEKLRIKSALKQLAEKSLPPKQKKRSSSR
jgi:peptide deformylase